MFLTESEALMKADLDILLLDMELPEEYHWCYKSRTT
jgi:hypothetical protein